MTVKVPAHIQPYIEILGEDLGIQFLLRFGGGYAYLSENPQARSPIVALIGRDKAVALAKEVGSGSLRIPIGKPFIAQYFRSKGWTVNAIAQKLHSQDTTVRGWLKPPPDDRQLKLI